ncbi:MAG: hypothetical protein LBD04_01845, partial [Synergistaceae bacterium]|nr:hypothetical protein [Synergistaceae bacterium]
DEIRFADGTVWKWDEVIGRKVVRGTNGNDSLRASSYAGEKVTVYGLGGNDFLYGGNGEDVFIPGTGSNTVYARSNYEGGGKKTFVWNVGDGNSGVGYYNEARAPGDGLGALRFGAGVNPSDVEVRNSGANVVFVVTLGGVSGSVTFVNANIGDIRYQLDEIRFIDGTVWQWATMPRQ